MRSLKQRRRFLSHVDSRAGKFLANCYEEASGAAGVTGQLQCKKSSIRGGRLSIWLSPKRLNSEVIGSAKGMVQNKSR
jgi:hypothetical protein